MPHGSTAKTSKTATISFRLNFKGILKVRQKKLKQSWKLIFFSTVLYESVPNITRTTIAMTELMPWIQRQHYALIFSNIRKET